MINRRREEPQPVQVGARVSGGAEAAIHAISRLMNHMPDDHVLVKSSFQYHQEGGSDPPTSMPTRHQNHTALCMPLACSPKVTYVWK